MRKLVLMFYFTLSLINFGYSQIETSPLAIGEKFRLYSKYNDTYYNISVCLPENYSSDTVDYSCLYLFYGHEPKFLAASGIATSLFDATWQIPKLIIVGVTNIQWQRDLTPVPIKGRENCGGAKDFLSFISQDLFKAIDENYRTNQHRIFMGHSFGGLFGVYSFMENPEYFDDFILISPSISERADYIQDAFKEKIMSSDSLTNKFYFSIGSEGSRMTRSSLWLEEGLESKHHKNLTWEFEMFEGHNHHTHTQISLINGLLYIFEQKD